MTNKDNRISYRNNWEAHEYSTSSGRIGELKKVSINGHPYDVITKQVSVPYSDHGHNYTAESDQYYVEEDVFGVPMLIALSKITESTDVIALDFKLVD